MLVVCYVRDFTRTGDIAMAMAAKKESDLSLFTNLHDATRRYRLRPTVIMDNANLANHLGLEHHAADYMGMPNCCFFLEGRIVAIRTKADEVAIFHLWQRFQHKMEEIAERVE